MTPTEFAASGARTFAEQLTDCQTALAQSHAELARRQQLMQAQNKAIQEATDLMQQQMAVNVEAERRIAAVDKQVHEANQKAKEQMPKLSSSPKEFRQLGQLKKSGQLS